MRRVDLASALLWVEMADRDLADALSNLDRAVERFRHDEIYSDVAGYHSDAMLGMETARDEVAKLRGALEAQLGDPDDGNPG